MAKKTSAERIWELDHFPSEEARARWLFEFLRSDLATLTPGQHLGMRQDARGFAEVELVEQDGDLEIGKPEESLMPAAAALPQLQASVRAGLDSVLAGNWWMLDRPVKYGIARMGPRIIRGQREGRFTDHFLAAAMGVVETWWVSLKSCPRCGALFVKSGKQQYCSPDCSQKARWHRFKAHRPGRNYRGERERAITKRLGPKAKVKLGKRRRSET